MKRTRIYADLGDAYACAIVMAFQFGRAVLYRDGWLGYGATADPDHIARLEPHQVINTYPHEREATA